MVSCTTLQEQWRYLLQLSIHSYTALTTGNIEERLRQF